MAFDLYSLPYIGDQLAVVAELAHRVGPEGPVVDIGCGSGRHLAYLLDLLPGRDVIGVEPSPAMRGLAVQRLAERPDWRERATVRPEDFLTVPLPPVIAGVVMLGVLGHWGTDERQQVWRRLAEVLPAGAPVLFDLQLPAEPTEVPHSVFASEQLGHLTYRGSASAEPMGGDAMRWTMTHEVLDGNRVLESHSAEHIYHHPHRKALAAELVAAGFDWQPGPESTHCFATRTTQQR